MPESGGHVDLAYHLVTTEILSFQLVTTKENRRKSVILSDKYAAKIKPRQLERSSLF